MAGYGGALAPMETTEVKVCLPLLRPFLAHLWWSYSRYAKHLLNSHSLKEIQTHLESLGVFSCSNNEARRTFIH